LADRQSSVVVKEATMSWMSRFRASGEESADPLGETVINGAPHKAEKAIQRSGENAAAPGDSPAVQIAEEIKRRQVSLAVRYVVAVRAR
jgi:hypothetical protein